MQPAAAIEPANKAMDRSDERRMWSSTSWSVDYSYCSPRPRLDHDFEPRVNRVVDARSRLHLRRWPASRVEPTNDLRPSTPPSQALRATSSSSSSPSRRPCREVTVRDKRQRKSSADLGDLARFFRSSRP